jgi:Protein of unknown function (DUF2924)
MLSDHGGKGSLMPRQSLDTQLTALEAMSADELKAEWRRVHRSPPPSISRSLLVLALGFDVQCRAMGKMASSTRNVLRNAEHGAPRSTPVPNGARLMRSWNGQTYVVETSEDGVIRWNNREWRSLSEVARAITGTRWSGPAFFGLRSRKEAGA